VEVDVDVTGNQQLATMAMPLTVPVAPGAHPTSAGAPRLLEQAGPHRPKGGEAQQVATLVLQKLARDSSDNGDDAAATLAVRGAFLQHRFTARLSAYELADRLYSCADTTLNLASVAAGIGASVLAASGAEKGWTIMLGAAIASCQSFSQWLKPSKRAAHRGRAAAELRNEAWDLLQGRDRYRDKDINGAWDVFCDRVDGIEDLEQTVKDGEERSGLPTGGQGGAGSG
jgi:hypothetical protein